MLRAQKLKRDIIIDPSSAFAIDVDGDLKFDSGKPPNLTVPQASGGFGSIGDKLKARDKAVRRRGEEGGCRAVEAGLCLVSPLDPKQERYPFALCDIHLQIPGGEHSLGPVHSADLRY